MKKIVLLLCLGIAVIMAGGFAYAHHHSGGAYKITDKEWAFHNSGQEVNGSAGEEGVDLNIEEVWKGSYEFDEVKIGIVDTGVEVADETIGSHICVNEQETEDGKDNDHNGYVDDINGWDFYNNDGTVFDKYRFDYHGTYLANEILKANDNASLVIAKFLNGSYGDADDAARAVEYCIDRGAQIICCSWTYGSENKALLKIIENNPDVLFVCSAGNTLQNIDESSLYPACYSDHGNVITVGAIDNCCKLYEASGYGMKVDLYAPGVDIFAKLPEETFDYVDGTSVSAAYTAACASMIKGHKHEAKAADMKKCITEAVSKNSSLKGKCATGGYLNMERALDLSEKL